MWQDWICYRKDALGLSCGLSVSWNPLKAQFTPYSVKEGIPLGGNFPLEEISTQNGPPKEN